MATFCLLCEAPIEGARSDVLYCSAACRQKAYRRRPAQLAAAAAFAAKHPWAQGVLVTDSGSDSCNGG